MRSARTLFSSAALPCFSKEDKEVVKMYQRAVAEMKRANAHSTSRSEGKWEGEISACSTQSSVQPLRVVQPDAVCEVGGSTPGLSHGDLGICLGGGQAEEFVH